VRHARASGFLVTEQGESLSKAAEAARVYSHRYGTADTIYEGLLEPDFDESEGRRRHSRR
jgi:hypothetical protein